MVNLKCLCSYHNKHDGEVGSSLSEDGSPEDSIVSKQLSIISVYNYRDDMLNLVNNLKTQLHSNMKL